MSAHHCHARGCPTTCKPERLMCAKHWRKVPERLQAAVWANYRPGQCDDKNPSAEWHTAADAAIQFVADLEAKDGRAVQLSAKSVEHYGPAYIGDMVRAVFGGPINLDPASCDQANLLIGAERIYTKEVDGLAQPWDGTVYNNPPGGETLFNGQTVNSAALWYATCAHRHALGHVPQAVFMVFNQELFRYAQRYQVRHPLEFPACFPKHRLDFWKPGPDGLPQPQGAPGHPNAIVYMGPNVERFRDTFSVLGKVLL